MQTVALWPALALLAGAGCGTFLEVPARASAAILFAAWLLSIVAWWSGRARVVVAAVAAGFAAGAALVAADAAMALHQPSILHHLSEGPVVLEGCLRDDAAATEFGATMTMDVMRVRDGESFTRAAGGVRLSVGGALVPARLAEWRAGRLLRVTAALKRPLPYRNFGLPDQEERLALRGVRLVGSVKSAALVEVVGRASPWGEAAAWLRAWSRRAIARAVGSRDPEAGAIVLAVLIGDRAGLSAGVERRLQRAGTFHVIAISGGNVAVLAGLVLWSVGRSGLPPRTRAAIAAAVLLSYGGIVMGGASVGRATLGAVLYLAARAIDLRTPPRQVIAATLGTLLAWDPVLVADVGFWLTFLASLAIVEQAAHVAGRFERGWVALAGRPLPRMARGAALLFAATVAAEAALAPVVIYAFSQATAAGLVLNFAAIPLMAVVQGAGLAALAADVVHPGLAALPGAVAAWGARAILESARGVDLVPWAVLRVAAPPLWLAALAIAGWAIASFAPGRATRVAGAAAWALLLVVLLAAPVLPALPATLLRHAPCPLPPARDGWLRVSVLDVGQGAAALLRLPEGLPILVDAGGAAYASRFDLGGRVVSPAVWALGVRRLGVLVLTHGDADHVGGAPAVVGDLAPLEIWEGVPVPGVPAIERVRAAAIAAGARWTPVERGDLIRAGRTTIHVRHPPPPEWERRRVRNDDSIVLDLRIGDVSIVLPGDIGGAVERDVAAEIPAAPLRVLLAAHHGSRGATSAGWLQALAPRIVIVSAGRDNPHGHPTEPMLDRVRAAGASLYRTDLDGAIEVDTNGDTVIVTTCSGRTMTHRRD